MYEYALNILNILHNNGFKSYIVGGYVRDKLLGIKSNDIDITTNATLSDLEIIFGNDSIKYKDYGSIILKYMDYTFEITTFRKDISSIDNRRPLKVEYVGSINEDILRRDFTINTICIDYNGDYLDILNAKDDIDNRVIKTVIDPTISIRNDAFRILRAIRFACVLNFKLDKSLVNAIINNYYLLENISFFRKKSELDAIFKSDNVHYGISLILDLKLDNILCISGLNAVVYTSNYLGIWAQLDYSKDYNFTKKEKKVINDIRKIVSDGNIDIYTLYKYDLQNVLIAAQILGLLKDKIINIYNKMPIHSRCDINMPTIDIDELGLKIKDIYIDLEYKILYNKLKNEKDEILKYINDNYGGI